MRAPVLISFLCCSIVLLGAIESNAQFSLIPPSKSFEEERAEMSKQHEAIKAEFGGEVDDPELAAYISRVGRIVVKNSDMPNNPFDFTVVNSPIPNAFTVGGGYVYITRGMLALMNDEAELVGVLGHEVGHVTARHLARRETKMKWAQYETGIVALLTGSPLLLGAKGLSDATKFKSYSRTQERQADNLGFKTLKKAGYDLNGMTEMLSSLQRFVRLQSTMVGQDLEKQMPAWLSDHPATDERIRNMTLKAGLARLTAPNQTQNFRKRYLDAIDGLMYGDDPQQGTLRDGVFYHTGLGFAFNVQKDFRVENKPQAVIGVKDDDLAMLFAGMQWPADKGLEEYAANTWLQLTAGSLGPIDQIQAMEINGMPAIRAVKSAQLRTLLGEVSLDIQTYVYRMNDDLVMHMSFVNLSEDTAKYQKLIEMMGTSFRRMNEQDALKARPYRVVIVEIGPKDNMATMADRMAFPDFKLARFKANNGIDTYDQFRQLDRVKIIVQSE